MGDAQVLLKIIVTITMDTYEYLWHEICGGTIACVVACLYLQFNQFVERQWMSGTILRTLPTLFHLILSRYSFTQWHRNSKELAQDNTANKLQNQNLNHLRLIPKAGFLISINLFFSKLAAIQGGTDWFWAPEWSPKRSPQEIPSQKHHYEEWRYL